MDTLALTLRNTDPRGLPVSHSHAQPAPPPASVSAVAWESLARQMVFLQLGAEESEGGLQRSVREVVRGMRGAGESWEAVYHALALAVANDEPAHRAAGSGTEAHRSYSAALVAHMHCWADCERLEELERGA